MLLLKLPNRKLPKVLPSTKPSNQNKKSLKKSLNLKPKLTKKLWQRPNPSMFNKRFILEKSQMKAFRARKLLHASRKCKNKPLGREERKRAEIILPYHSMNLRLKQKATLVVVTIVATIVITAVITVTDVITVAVTPVAVETETDATTEIIRSIKTTFLAWDESDLNIDWKRKKERYSYFIAS